MGFVSHEHVYFEGEESLGTLKQTSTDACCMTCSGMGEQCTVWSYCSDPAG